MFQFRRRVLVNLLKLSDICIFMMGLFWTSWLATARMDYVNLVDFLSMRIKLVNLIGLLVMMFLWHIVCSYFRLYHSRRLQGYAQEWKDIVKATIAGTVILFVGAQIFRVALFTQWFTLGFWVLTTLLTISFRSLLRYLLKRVRAHGINLRFILIVGTNKRAYDFVETIKENRETGYRVVGYIDDFIHTPRQGVSLLATLKDFPDLIRELIIDEVVIALPIKSYYENIQGIIDKAEEQGVTIRCLSHPFNTKFATINTALFDGHSVLEISPNSPDGPRYVAKRALDIVAGSLLMLLTFPVMLVAAIAIKLTSSGPVFFVQDRVGYNKRIFRLYKFRTMVADAEKGQKKLETLNEMDGPVFKIRDDPRITAVGRWLRRMSIDELPQLYNVLKGDMSLVGPRPLPVRDYNGFRKDWQRRRFSVRPGLTCLWQVTGRGFTSFEDWMNLDMEYIDGWTLSGDMKILLKTVPAVLNGKGAS